MSILFHAPYPVVLKCIQEEEADEFGERTVDDKNASEKSSPRSEKGSIMIELCSDIIREVQKDFLNVTIDNDHQSYEAKSPSGTSLNGASSDDDSAATSGVPADGPDGTNVPSCINNGGPAIERAWTRVYDAESISSLSGTEDKSSEGSGTNRNLVDSGRILELLSQLKARAVAASESTTAAQLDEIVLLWSRIRVGESSRTARVIAVIRSMQERSVEKLQMLRSLIEEDMAARATSSATRKSEGAAIAAEKRDAADAADAAQGKADELVRVQARLRATRDDLAASAFEVQRLKRLLESMVLRSALDQSEDDCRRLAGENKRLTRLLEGSVPRAQLQAAEDRARAAEGEAQRLRALLEGSAPRIELEVEREKVARLTWQVEHMVPLARYTAAQDEVAALAGECDMLRRRVEGMVPRSELGRCQDEVARLASELERAALRAGRTAAASAAALDAGARSAAAGLGAEALAGFKALELEALCSQLEEHVAAMAAAAEKAAPRAVLEAVQAECRRLESENRRLAAGAEALGDGGRLRAELESLCARLEGEVDLMGRAIGSARTGPAEASGKGGIGGCCALDDGGVGALRSELESLCARLESEAGWIGKALGSVVVPRAALESSESERRRLTTENQRLAAAAAAAAAASAAAEECLDRNPALHRPPPGNGVSLLMGTRPPPVKDAPAGLDEGGGELRAAAWPGGAERRVVGAEVARLGLELETACLRLEAESGRLVGAVIAAEGARAECRSLAPENRRLAAALGESARLAEQRVAQLSEQLVRCQDEGARLAAENEQLSRRLGESGLAAETEKLAAINQRLAGENERLRLLLSEPPSISTGGEFDIGGGGGGDDAVGAGGAPWALYVPELDSPSLAARPASGVWFAHDDGGAGSREQLAPSPEWLSLPVGASCGVGMLIRRYDGAAMPVVVEHLTPGGPAALSGQVRPRDRLLAVDGREVAPLSTGAIAALIAGPEGSSVHLRLARFPVGGGGGGSSSSSSGGGGGRSQPGGRSLSVSFGGSGGPGGPEVFAVVLVRTPVPRRTDGSEAPAGLVEF